MDNATKNGSDDADAYTFSDSLALTSFGKFNYFLIFISGMVLATVLLETAGIGFILPIAQCDLELSNVDKGVLSAVGFLGIISSSHLWGFLADTKGRRKVIRPTLLAGFTVTVFSSFAPNFWVMAVLRFFNGFFVAGSATIYAFLGEFHSTKTRSRAIMGSSVIYAIGVMIMPMLAFLVISGDWVLPLSFLGIDYKPWRLFLIVCGMPGFLCGLSLFFLPESPKFLVAIGKDTKAIQVLQKIHRWNGGKEPLVIKRILLDDDMTISTLNSKKNLDSNSNFAVLFFHTMWNQTAPLFQRKYLRITMNICNMQFWLFVVANGLFLWFPDVINSITTFYNENPGEHKRICQIIYENRFTNGTSECIDKLENNTYYYSLILEILCATSYAVIGVIITRVGKKLILFTIAIFFTSSGLTSMFITDPYIASYLYLIFFLLSVGINVLSATTVDLYPTHLRAMAVSISLMVGRLGSVTGAYAAGALLTNHCELSFYIVFGAMYICAILVLFLPRKSPDEEVKNES